MKEFLDVQGSGKQLMHRYPMEQVGLNEVQIESASEPYRERLRAFF